MVIATSGTYYIGYGSVDWNSPNIPSNHHVLRPFTATTAWYLIPSRELICRNEVVNATHNKHDSLTKVSYSFLPCNELVSMRTAELLMLWTVDWTRIISWIIFHGYHWRYVMCSWLARVLQSWFVLAPGNLQDFAFQPQLDQFQIMHGNSLQLQ